MASETTYNKEIIRGKVDFFKGFPSLNDYSNEIELDKFNRIKLFFLTRFIFLYRYLATLLNKQQNLEKVLSKGLVKHNNHVLKARSNPSSVEENLARETLAGKESFYLSPEEVAEFETTGLLEPFDVITAEQAEELASFAYNNHQSGAFTQTSIFDEATISVLKRSGQWRLDYSGLYQANRFSNLREVLRRPEIAHRMASLLGDDVICWRSQFFEKRPGEIGTFWHQNSVFRETGKNAKLIAPEGVEPGMIQLTAWIALTDVTCGNGALRMIPGSFTDSAVEYFYNFIQDNKLDYVSSLEKDEIIDFMKLALFSTGTFYKAQAVFDAIYDRVDNLFQGKRIVDLEMKAGQAIIFSSLNMHASYPNTTSDDTRLAFAGRYCNNDVKVFNNMSHGVLTTSEGPRKYDLTKLGLLQIHGEDHFGHNNILS